MFIWIHACLEIYFERGQWLAVLLFAKSKAQPLIYLCFFISVVRIPVLDGFDVVDGAFIHILHTNSVVNTL